MLFSIDGTFSKQLAVFVNDSPHGNAAMRKVECNGDVRLCLFALEDIPFGAELRYDYGDKDLWWRKKVTNLSYHLRLLSGYYILFLFFISLRY